MFEFGSMIFPLYFLKEIFPMLQKDFFVVAVKKRGEEGEKKKDLR